MFTNIQGEEVMKKYQNTLKLMGSLSNLFSESSSPYLGYRAVENIFCKVFNAENLSRSDCSADASKDKIGIGIKTFLNGNGKTLQKIAEFNSDLELYRDKNPKEIIKTVSRLRNERLEATKRIHGLEQLIYHCVVRDVERIMVFECPMDKIDVDKIKNIKIKEHVLSFEDNKNEYSFNMSKSTLYKRFITKNIILDFKVNIIEDPYIYLENILLENCSEKLIFAPIKQHPHIYLPLFSDKGVRNVPERSGLNQWNARGRARDYNEVYIPIPSLIHKKFPGFFPPRDISFNLKLPNGKNMSAKVCQDGSKALMSNPNKELGEWILREVMRLKEGELLTYNKLQELGLDSVVIYKLDDNNFTIDFTAIGSYDEFVDQNK
ncbi:restriction endonuclease PLD domain-containing protein [Clostridium cochlearium]|uniref:restriction endonuclease PLD domain-containing protein n=1 Tax=Clostridium cochlearium TaxID=1494 RepID=UPI000B947159|nr:restriction endonuclease PLD domain-containing protein [Clostridium cochlearium]MBU5270131.1 NgoFVII family restriction endonuclease [Clostridium cochlearium]MBU5270148.1 NgoFVII family restriction endonuclease [Clostridium cochlearium]SNV83796.1 NgoFVII restriction endonuclease [Clostridium cochlearium]STA93134.1 NgoFVII restriction endonuclease [Clostridium cochlearium]